MKKLPVALQVYSVIKAFSEDPVSTIKRIAKLGYEGVELIAMFGGLTPKELRGVIEGEGLIPISAHIPVEMWNAEGEACADKLAELGLSYAAIPWLAEDKRPGQPGYQGVVDSIGQISEWLRKRNITLLYHNHDFEFVIVDGEYALDRLYKSTTPEQLQAELDIYWIKYAGECPADYVRKYKNRLPILHLKDMEDTPERFFTEVGNGTQNLPDIFTAAEEAGVLWYVVEQDASRIDPMDSARISRENLTRLGT